MTASRGSGNPQHDLNHMAPAANVVKLGDRMYDLITNYNILASKFNALVTALGAGGGNVPSLATVDALPSPASAIATLTAPGAPEITGDRP